MPLSPCTPPQVNTAARMQSTSEQGCVQLSESAASVLLRNPADDLHLVPRGSRTIKGKVPIEREHKPSPFVSLLRVGRLA